jgi:triacylglycerol lipase
MSTAHLPHAEGPVPETGASPAAPPQLQVEDVLASPRRLWLRGRLTGVNPATTANGRAHRWWGRPASPAPTARLECQVGGTRLTTDVALLPDGRFEALLAADLPPARRGWRVARPHLSWDGKTAETCAIVLLPPADAVGALVVVLPLACTFPAGAASQLARQENAGHLGPLLRRLIHGPAGTRPLYYLAGVPVEAPGRSRELALAIASLGWPAGQVVPMPSAPPLAEVLTEGLDRLRWLLAGALDLLVLNLEPSAAEALAAVPEQQDRARIVRLVNPGEGPVSLLDLPAAGVAPLPARHLRPSRSGRVTRYPLVFCHGMLAFSTLRMQLPDDLNSFTALRPLLRERGFRALFPQVAPTSGIAARAAQLRDKIRAWTDEPVNIIAHSMGGLDARYMISRLGMAEHVRSLTTVGTPHRGTALADWFIANYRHRVPVLLALELFGTNVDGFADCRPAACADFNRKTPDAPNVSYFSYGGAVPQSRVSPILRRPWSILTPLEGPNDGMVSVASAHWGAYLGTVEADHFAQTPDAVFLRPGEDFDAVRFCMKMVEDLAYRGF